MENEVKDVKNVAKDSVRVILQKQWYKKNGELKAGFSPVIQTMGASILCKTIMHRDFYKLQELADRGVIELVEVNTKETAKDLDKAE